MPRLRHSLGWNSSVDAVEASKKPQNEQEDTSDGVVDEEQGSFHVLRETLSEHVIRHIAASSKSSQATARSRKKGGKNASSEEHGDLHDKTDAQGIDVQELQEFIEVRYQAWFTLSTRASCPAKRKVRGSNISFCST